MWEFVYYDKLTDEVFVSLEDPTTLLNDKEYYAFTEYVGIL